MDFPRLFHQQLDVQRGLYSLQRIAHFATAKPGLIYAALYYADRERITYSGRTIYGETYLAYRHAPVPSWANHVYMTLKMPTRDLSFYMKIRDKFLINQDGVLVNKDMTAKGDYGLSHYDRTALDEAIRWHKSASGQDILIGRRDKSWVETLHGAPIDVHVLMRNGRKPVARGVDELPPEKDGVLYHELAPHYEGHAKPHSSETSIGTPFLTPVLT